MKKYPIRLQLFAEPPQGQQAAEQQEGTQQNGTQQQDGTPPAFDYDKLANIISGKQSVAEDTVLKNYFRQQGLSKEEMDKAIAAYKTEKAKNQPDTDELQSKLAEAQKQAQQAALNQAATLEAISLGIDAKTIPYILRMAETEKSIKDDGTINQEALKEAISKVLEDIPALKPPAKENKGFQYAGTGDGNQAGQGQNDAIAGIFGNAK